MPVRVKICGVTRSQDAAWACDCGADAVGLVFAPSPRRVTPEQARKVIAGLGPLVTPVALFVNEKVEEIRRICADLGVVTVQLHGDETPQTVRALRPLRVIKAVRVGTPEDVRDLDRWEADAVLLDTRAGESRGGTGKTFDWDLAVEPARRLRVILAGGLVPGNVAEAVRRVRPYGVDVSSGVEESPGVKDRHKVEEFIRQARTTF